MADEEFRKQRLASILDALDPDRSDLEVYAAIATEFQATRVLDVGCGTGALALMLVNRGISVVGVDPARASLDIARSKLGGMDVRWIEGDATRLPPLEVDLATMTGNVAQAIIDEDDWHATLQGVYEALTPGGLLVFETRIPSRKAWLEWNRAASHRVTDIAGIGPVETWVDLLHTKRPARHVPLDIRLPIGRRGDIRVDHPLPRPNRNRGSAHRTRLHPARGSRRT